MPAGLAGPAHAIVFAVVIGDLGRGHVALRPGEADKLLQRVADAVRACVASWRGVAGNLRSVAVGACVGGIG